MLMTLRSYVEVEGDAGGVKAAKSVTADQDSVSAFISVTRRTENRNLDADTVPGGLCRQSIKLGVTTLDHIKETQYF